MSPPHANPNEPVEILEEEWFVENVILNPQAAGAVRSLLGKDFGLPTLISSNLLHCPEPGGNWHRDAGFMYGPALHYLRVFYYPQDTPLEAGPSLVLPGSHFLFSTTGHMAHHGSIRGEFSTDSTAGTIFITVYSIWHRRPPSRGTWTREHLKCNYWRTSPPNRDWIKDPTSILPKRDMAPGEVPRYDRGFDRPMTKQRCSSGCVTCANSYATLADKRGRPITTTAFHLI